MDLVMVIGDLEAARSGDRQTLERARVRPGQDFRHAGLTITGLAGPLTLGADRSRPSRGRKPAREYPDS